MSGNFIELRAQPKVVAQPLNETWGNRASEARGPSSVTGQVGDRTRQRDGNSSSYSRIGRSSGLLRKRERHLDKHARTGGRDPNRLQGVRDALPNLRSRCLPLLPDTSDDLRAARIKREV